MSNKRPYFSSADNRSKDPYSNMKMPYSFGLSVPRNGLYACLCADKNTYSRKCCKGYLLNQGIGNIYGTNPVYIGAFQHESFNFGFQGGKGTAKQIQQV